MSSDQHTIEKFGLKLEDLTDNMVITAYTRFGHRYTRVNSEVCKFVRHNFFNCKISIKRKNRELKIDSDVLQEGDTILRIYDFPPELTKLVNVNSKLIKALKYRDILEFDVKQKAEVEDDTKKKHLCRFMPFNSGYNLGVWFYSN